MGDFRKISALEAVSETLSKFHGDDPIFTKDELSSLSDREADYAISDLMEAVRNLNSAEISYLVERLSMRGLALGDLYVASDVFISRILSKKKWSNSDLEIVGAAYEWLPDDQKERFRLHVPT